MYVHKIMSTKENFTMGPHSASSILTVSFFGGGPVLDTSGAEGLLKTPICNFALEKNLLKLGNAVADSEFPV